MNTARNILKWTVIVTVCLTSVCFTFLVSRKPWIGPPVPGVRLSPWRPILRPEDVKPDSAFGVLQQGLDLLKSEGDSFDIETNLADMAEHDPTNPALAEALIRFEPALALVRKAAVIKEGRQVPHVPNYNAVFPYIPSSRSVGRLLFASAYRKAAFRDMAGAMDDFSTTIQVADILSRGGAIIHALVSIAIGGSAATKCFLLAVQHDLPPVVCSTMERELAVADQEIEPLSESFRYDYVSATNAIDAIFDGAFTGGAAKTPVYWPYLLLGAKILGSDEPTAQKNMASVFSHVIASEDSSLAWPRMMNPLARFSDVSPWTMLRYRDPVGLCLANMIMPASDMAFSRYIQYRFDLRAAQVALAINQYKQVHAEPPKVLSELVPDFLEKVPEDPFRVGHELLYRCDADKQWLVYSVATNGVDDGGVEGPEDGMHALDFVMSTRDCGVVTNAVGGR